MNVATPTKNPTQRLAKRSKVEIIKEKSDYLRHPLMQELVNDETFISEEAVQLMKFHGSYQQDHREQRTFGQGKAYMFMMRTRQPAGAVTNQLYLAMDELADKVGACDGERLADGWVDLQKIKLQCANLGSCSQYPCPLGLACPLGCSMATAHCA
jgi:hypothetical protein